MDVGHRPRPGRHGGLHRKVRSQKNIDGYRLDADLFGNDAVTASHQVEPWAATWRMRQFH
jgi:hypothetical protein